MPNFADRLIREIEKKESVTAIGLDPRPELLPKEILRAALKGRKPTASALAEAFTFFGKGVIDAVAGHCVAVKIQVAFYEMLGPSGMTSFLETQKYARSKGLLVIGDVKRGDIGSTGEAYAKSYLGRVYFRKTLVFSSELDAITVNPYFGTDGVEPFLREAGKERKGLFFLIKTSNPSSREIQAFPNAEKPLFVKTAKLVNSWAKDYVGSCGFSSVGGVVGATHPKDAERIRKIVSKSFLLVPGYGAQGGKSGDLGAFFIKGGKGALITSSRAIIFAYRKGGRQTARDWQVSIEAAAEKMKKEINKIR